MKVYCYSRCTTCKKALKWLDEKGKKYDLIDIKEDNPSRQVIEDAYKKSGLPLKRFFNTSGMAYREMGLSKKLKDMSESDQLDLLASDGMLVKRPFLIDGDKVLLGFKEDQWVETL